MKITVKTAEFKKMVAKAIKGAGNNRLLPITSMMLISKNESTDNRICLTTTDTMTWFNVFGEAYTGEPFYCVVPADIFSKLVSKLTCDKVTLEVIDDVLKVTGNGTYKISLPVDEEGLVTYPEFSPAIDGDTGANKLKLSTVKAVIAVNKAALSTSTDDDCFCAYYLADKAITSDENAICFSLMNICSQPMLISRNMFDLVSSSDNEDISFTTTADGAIKFYCGDLTVIGWQHSGLEEFPVEDMCTYLDKAFTSSCKVTKLSMQAVLDRLSLFIEPYDRNGAYFIFQNDGILIKSKKSSLEELVRYADSTNFTPFVCCVDVPLFKAQLESIPTDNVEISFGDENAIKLSSGNIVSVIALFEDEELSNNAVAN